LDPTPRAREEVLLLSKGNFHIFCKTFSLHHIRYYISGKQPFFSPGISFSRYIGLFGFGASGVAEEEEAGGEAVDGGVLVALDVAALFTHASFPSSSRTRNQSFFSSRIASEVPFFTVRTTL
jgi:hypothetical protein